MVVMNIIMLGLLLFISAGQEVNSLPDMRLGIDRAVLYGQNPLSQYW